VILKTIGAVTLKNITHTLLIILVLIGLSACGNNPSDDLQSQKWNVVATNGESYTAEFGESTVSFKMGSLSRGFTYEINDNEISLIEAEKDPIVFEMEKEGDEYIFTATTESVEEQFGDLTLSPTKE
jgi:hypothetical protein